MVLVWNLSMCYGMAHSSEGIHPKTKNGVVTREYSLWHAMITRCTTEKYASYKDCEVSERWLDFQNFCDDLPSLPGYDDWLASTDRKIHLDKDVLIKGNKVYSKEACSFITQVENIRDSALRRWGVDPEEYEPIQIGQEFENQYGQYEVVEIVNSQEVTVKFKNTGSLVVDKSWEVRNGYVSDREALGYTLRKDIKYVKVGDKYPTDHSGLVEVLEFFSPNQVRVRFIETGIERVYSNGEILSGSIRDFSMYKSKLMKSGEIFQNSYGQRCVIVDYYSAVQVLIKFIESGESKIITAQRLKDRKFPDTSELGQDFIELFRSERLAQRDEYLKINRKKFSYTQPVFPEGLSKREKQILEFEGKEFNTKKSGVILVTKYITASEVEFVFLSTGKSGVATVDRIRKGSVSF